ncbi:MAG: ATP-binding protein [Planctomycetota bacterium]
MNITDEQFEKWQYATESDSLDFKSEQYKFNNAKDEEKSELLKDIVAMANSWCSTDAYIVIGIEEKPEKPNGLLGITEHIDDANLQQFINSKTNRICRFEYISYTYKEKTYGIIRIPRQPRPIYLNKNYCNKLYKNTVYIRRGSSTDEAKPDEIAAMGKEPRESRKAQLKAELFDNEKGKPIGREYAGSVKEIIINESIIPDYNGGLFQSNLHFSNVNYYRDMIKYTKFHASYLPLYFSITNFGELEAVNIRFEVEFSNQVSNLLNENDRVSEPSKSFQPYIRPGDSENQFSIKQFNDRWIATIQFDRLHAKRILPIESYLYLKVDRSEEISGKTRIYYDGKDAPDEMEILIKVECNSLEMSLYEIEHILTKES